jgi:hypothetical protein
MSISALGSVNGKKLGRKRRIRSSVSKKALQKSVDDLQVLEAHVLADPQAFDLVEHGRVGRRCPRGRCARRDHADLGHLTARKLLGVLLACAGVADLHRAGVGAQQNG